MKKITQFTVRAVGMVMFLFAFIVLGVSAASAAIITVTNTSDSGQGSLRQALIISSTNGEINTVNFAIPTSDPGFESAINSFRIQPVTQLPGLPASLAFTIQNTQAQQVIIDANNQFTVFTVPDSADITIINLVLTEGNTAGNGAGISIGMSAVVNLNNTQITNSSANSGGGGIFLNNSSTLNINNSTISGNSSSTSGGFGGGIFLNPSATVNLTNSTINNNTAAFGGGIFVGISATVTTTNTTLDGNVASSNGGGIANRGTITLNLTTVSGNGSGGIGGIENLATATLNSTLVATNTTSSGNGPDLGGNPFAGTFNLIGNADGSSGLAPSTNQLGTTAAPIDPKLGSLANNGGPTQTRALLSGSPAIDAGSSAVIRDQRNFIRPFDNPAVPNFAGSNGVDVGAFEVQAAPTAAEVTITGRALNGRRGIRNATIILIEQNGNQRYARTGITGNYRFTDVDAGTTIILTANAKGYVFQQPIQVISVNETLVEINFYTIERRSESLKRLN